MDAAEHKAIFVDTDSGELVKDSGNIYKKSFIVEDMMELLGFETGGPPDYDTIDKVGVPAMGKAFAIPHPGWRGAKHATYIARASVVSYNRSNSQLTIKTEMSPCTPCW